MKGGACKNDHQACQDEPSREELNFQRAFLGDVGLVSVRNPSASLPRRLQVPGLDTELVIGAKHEKGSHPRSQLRDLIMLFGAESQKCR